MISRLLPSGWRNEAVYFAIFNLTNVLNYVYLVLVGFFVGADSYGLFGALFGIVYLASAVGNTVKMAVARHVAAARARTGGEVARRDVVGLLAWSAAFAALVALALVAATPAIANAFDSPTEPVLWAGLAIALSIWVPTTYGILQGLERFPMLGSVLLVAAFLRITAGAALLAVGGGVSGALAGVVLGFAGSAVYAVFLCLRHARGGTSAEGWIGVPAPRIGALFTVLVAGLVIAAPTSLDVAIVRYVFSAEDAGVYTGISVLGRVILFASVAVPFTILPKVTARTEAGAPTGRLLAEGLAITGGLASAAAVGIVLATGALGWQLGGVDVSSASAALHWYLAAMVLFSLTVAIVHYQVGRSSGTFILAAGLPSVALQGILIALVPGSLTAVAQLLCALNAVLLAIGIASAVAGLRPKLSGETDRPRIRPGLEASR